MTWVVAAVVVLWLVRVAVEVDRWYWRRQVEREEARRAGLDPRLPLSHVRARRPLFDQDTEPLDPPPKGG